MTLLNESTLRTVMRTQLKTVASLPASKYRAWENRKFKPPEADEDQPWIREHVSILSERKSSTGYVEAVGTTQYSVYVPAGRGTAQADALAKAIAEAFEAGQSLTGTGLTVILERTERAPYRVDASDSIWVFKTVTSRWRVFTSSSTNG